MKNIQKVGIIGAGTMGRRIAYGCIIRGKETRLYDVLPEALKKAEKAIRKLIEERISAGKLPRRTLENRRASALHQFHPQGVRHGS